MRSPLLLASLLVGFVRADDCSSTREHSTSTTVKPITTTEDPSEVDVVFVEDEITSSEVDGTYRAQSTTVGREKEKKTTTEARTTTSVTATTASTAPNRTTINTENTTSEQIATSPTTESSTTTTATSRTTTARTGLCVDFLPFCPLLNPICKGTRTAKQLFEAGEISEAQFEQANEIERKENVGGRFRNKMRKAREAFGRMCPMTCGRCQSIMPMIHLATNVDVPEDFEVVLTDIMAKALKKPRDVILVQVTAKARMVHGAIPGPCAHVWVKSRGHLDGHLNNIYTEKITTLINAMTGVPKDKASSTVIEFYDLHGDYIGFNGATVTSAERGKQ